MKLLNNTLLSGLRPPIAINMSTTVCPPNADLVPDGRVDLLDIAKLVDEMDAGNLSMADLNCDGVLNVADTSVALGQWTG